MKVISSEVHGVLVSMSGGLYLPVIQVRQYLEDNSLRYIVCDYRSRAALEAGLAKPKHWAHAVYRTLERLCTENQAELQGGSMDAYHETAIDRQTAADALAGVLQTVVSTPI